MKTFLAALLISVFSINYVTGNAINGLPADPTKPRNTEVCVGQPDASFVNDPSSCSAYFTCMSGIGYPFNCPEGTLFDEVTKKCDFSENVNCLECLANQFERTHVTGDCNLYNLCFFGDLTVETCPPGLHFNRELRECDKPANAQCPLECPMSGPPSFLPSPTSCAEYHVCNNGVMVQNGTCATGLYFNPELNKCDLAINVDCTIDPPAEPKKRSRRAVPKITTNDCPSTGTHFISNPSDCAYYFICNNGVYTSRQCAAGLIFDLLSNNCNYPDQSVCIKEAIPTGPIVKYPQVTSSPARDNHNHLTAATPSGSIYEGGRTAPTPRGPW